MNAVKHMMEPNGFGDDLPVFMQMVDGTSSKNSSIVPSHSTFTITFAVATSIDWW